MNEENSEVRKDTEAEAQAATQVEPATEAAQQPVAEAVAEPAVEAEEVQTESVQEEAPEPAVEAVAESTPAASEEVSAPEEASAEPETPEVATEAATPAADPEPAAEAAPAKDAPAEEQEEEEKEPEEEKVLKDLDPARAALPWYVVHTYSGFEQLVKASLEERMKTENLEDKFGNILIPQETVVELVRGQKKTSTRKFLPGYIVVQMNLDDETWHFVSGTPKVTGFVGDSRNPMPLSKPEVENLIKQIEGGGQRPRPKVHFEEGDSVKVIDGPFADFNGTVDEVKPDKGKLRVLISIFGRNTPVELDFVQVEKA